MNNKKPRREAGSLFDGAPEEIRTPGLLIRSQTLYPAELRVLTVAEREGFEPSVPFEYAVLAGLWFKPLTHLSTSCDFILAEGEGFEPAVLAYGSFQDCCLKPLGQPSCWGACF